VILPFLCSIDLLSLRGKYCFITGGYGYLAALRIGLLEAGAEVLCLVHEKFSEVLKE
jgi:hypothetical protein